MGARSIATTRAPRSPVPHELRVAAAVAAHAAKVA